MFRTRATFKARGLALIALLTACGKASPPPPQAVPTVTVALALQRTVGDWNELTGQFAAVQNVEVRPQVAGYVSHRSAAVHGRPRNDPGAARAGAQRAGARRCRSRSRGNVVRRQRHVARRCGNTDGVPRPSPGRCRGRRGCGRDGTAESRMDGRARSNRRPRGRCRRHARQLRPERLDDDAVDDHRVAGSDVRLLPSRRAVLLAACDWGRSLTGGGHRARQRSRVSPRRADRLRGAAAASPPGCSRACGLRVALRIRQQSWKTGRSALIRIASSYMSCGPILPWSIAPCSSGAWIAATASCKAESRRESE